MKKENSMKNRNNHFTTNVSNVLISDRFEVSNNISLSSELLTGIKLCLTNNLRNYSQESLQRFSFDINLAINNERLPLTKLSIQKQIKKAYFDMATSTVTKKAIKEHLDRYNYVPDYVSKVELSAFNISKDKKFVTLHFIYRKNNQEYSNIKNIAEFEKKITIDDFYQIINAIFSKRNLNTYLDFNTNEDNYNAKFNLEISIGLINLYLLDYFDIIYFKEYDSNFEYLLFPEDIKSLNP